MVQVRASGSSSGSFLYPMTNLSSLTNEQAVKPLRITRANGIRVTDDQGKEYIEAMAGLWCAGLGWGNEEIIEATTKQMRDMSYYHCFAGRRFPAVEELSEKLLSIAPGRIQGGKTFFGQSGSDANDTQVRLLWHYNIARGKPEKRKVIARLKAYHGVTVAAGSITGLPYVHANMGLPLDFVARHISFPSYYRNGKPGETEADFVKRLATELETAIVEEGPETVAAFFAEPLQGAGGVYLPPTGYFPAIREVCDRHDVMLVSDEVITGFGRTGHMWGCEAFDMEPDTMSLAKQLTMSYMPLSAVMLPPKMCEVFEDTTARTGGIMGHGYTYSGHPVSCVVALKVLEILKRDQIVENVRDHLGPLFQQRLHKLSSHPLVGEARGIGLIGALEIVADKATKTSFPPASAVAARIAQIGIDHGIIIRPLPGDSLAVCPPLIVTKAEINEIFDRIETVLTKALEVFPPSS